MTDTTGPFYVAYVVVAVAYSAYAYSIWARAKRVREKIEAARKADPSLRSR